MIVPKLRFKDDNGNEYPEWGNTCVDDVFVKISEKNKNGENTNVITNSAEYGLVNQREFFDKDIAIEGKTKNYTIIKTNDFVYNPRKSSFAPYGAFNGYKLKDNGIVSPLYFCLRKKNDDMFTGFLIWYFKTNRWYRFIYENGEHGGVRHDRVGVSEEVVMGIPIDKPCLPEQKKIADFLSTVDEVIAQSEKEVKNLQLQKKAMMQRIFSQEIRFKQDDGTDYPEWEEKKLESITTSLKTGTLKMKDLKENSSYPVVNSGLDLYGYYDNYNNDGDVFTVASRGENVGNVHYMPNKFWAGGLCYPYRANEGYCTKYLAHYMTYSYKILRNLFMIKTGIPAINKSDLESFVLKIPSSLSEQKKIADFLSAYDDAIKYAKDELAQWKLLKKGLLQQMFI